MSNAPSVPTAPSDEAPFYLDSEYEQGGNLWTATASGPCSPFRERPRIALKAVNERREESRRRAWLACCALNAAHMAVPMAQDHDAQTRKKHDWVDTYKIVAGDPGDDRLSLESAEGEGEVILGRILPGDVYDAPIAAVDRSKAAALGLALVEFAATGKLPGEPGEEAES